MLFLTENDTECHNDDNEADQSLEFADEEEDDQSSNMQAPPEVKDTGVPANDQGFT